MKVAIIALVLAVSLIQSADAWWGWGGLYGGWGMGMGMWGYPYMWGKRDAAPSVFEKIPTELLNRTECVYSKESSILSCHGVTGLKECPVELKMQADRKIKFELFGLAWPLETSEIISEWRFRIFPRKLDNSAWISGTVDKDVSLYHSEKYNDYGLWVKDQKCFEDLVTLLKASLRRELVELEDKKTQVTIIGDIILAEKLPKFLQETEMRHTREEEPREPHHKYLEEERKLALVEEKIADIKREIEAEQFKSTIKRELLKEELKKVREIVTEMNPRDYKY